MKGVRVERRVLGVEQVHEPQREERGPAASRLERRRLRRIRDAGEEDGVRQTSAQ